jgi:phage shock protein E
MKKILTLMFIFMAFSIQADPVYWIDVRTAGEYNTGHVEGSINIPHGEIAEKITAVTEDKNAEIHLYCRSGNRSGKALYTLQQLGYTKAINEGAYGDVKERLEAKTDMPD